MSDDAKPPPAPNGEDTQSLEQKTQWLRDRGVEIETVEDRKLAEEMKKNPEKFPVDPASGYTYIRIPALSTTALSESAAPATHGGLGGDKLPDLLKYFFTDGKKANSELLTEQLEKLKSTNVAMNASALDPNKVTQEGLDKVIQAGSCETFTLVPPAETNKYQGIYIYLDEVGMLKQLPLNARAAELARTCGFNPAPTFYGDVYVGRVKTQPVMKNMSFDLADMDPHAEWRKRAMSENLARQQMLNSMTGNNGTQAGNDGEDGMEKEEQVRSLLPCESLLMSILSSLSLAVNNRAINGRRQTKKWRSLLLLGHLARRRSRLHSFHRASRSTKGKCWTWTCLHTSTPMDAHGLSKSLAMGATWSSPWRNASRRAGRALQRPAAIKTKASSCTMYCIAYCGTGGGLSQAKHLSEVHRAQVEGVFGTPGTEEGEKQPRRATRRTRGSRDARRPATVLRLRQRQPARWFVFVFLAA
jgi:hypothetical protein